MSLIGPLAGAGAATPFKRPAGAAAPGFSAFLFGAGGSAPWPTSRAIANGGPLGAGSARNASLRSMLAYVEHDLINQMMLQDRKNGQNAFADALDMAATLALDPSRPFDTPQSPADILASLTTGNLP